MCTFAFLVVEQKTVIKIKFSGRKSSFRIEPILMDVIFHKSLGPPVKATNDSTNSSKVKQRCKDRWSGVIRFKLPISPIFASFIKPRSPTSIKTLNCCCCWLAVEKNWQQAQAWANFHQENFSGWYRHEKNLLVMPYNHQVCGLKVPHVSFSLDRIVKEPSRSCK